jgi:hypothetical protein
MVQGYPMVILDLPQSRSPHLTSGSSIRHLAACGRSLTLCSVSAGRMQTSNKPTEGR